MSAWPVCGQELLTHVCEPLFVQELLDLIPKITVAVGVMDSCAGAALEVSRQLAGHSGGSNWAVCMV